MTTETTPSTETIIHINGTEFPLFKAAGDQRIGYMYIDKTTAVNADDLTATVLEFVETNKIDVLCSAGANPIEDYLAVELELMGIDYRKSVDPHWDGSDRMYKRSYYQRRDSAFAKAKAVVACLLVSKKDSLMPRPSTDGKGMSKPVALNAFNAFKQQQKLTFVEVSAA